MYMHLGTRDVVIKYILFTGGSQPILKASHDKYLDDRLEGQARKRRSE